MRDGLLPEEDPMVTLEIFEGPLDLLLHLVKINEVDIVELPMEIITRQYLETLKAMGKMELPIIGEYFVMAAELLKIKSQMLLPKETRAKIGDEVKETSHMGPDPRAELVRQLLEYQKLKANGALLEDKITAQSLSYPCLKAQPMAERPLKPFDRFELMSSYGALVRRLLERVAIGEIALDPYTVSQAIEVILDTLKESPSINFIALLQGKKHELGWMAAMFVGLLELVRLGEIDVAQEGSFGEIIIEKKAVAV